MAPRAAEAVDGRLGRTMRSRLAICEACLDLVQEGVLQPSADQVAERAGLSRRSIFNHFSDLAELYDAVVEVGTQRSASLLKAIDPDRPVAERVDRLTEVLSRFLEATANFSRALTAQSLVGPANEQARRVARDALEAHHQFVAGIFQRELGGLPPARRGETVDAMAAAIAAPHWEYLRRGRGLSMSRARAITRRTLRALLADAGVDLGG